MNKPYNSEWPFHYVRKLYSLCLYHIDIILLCPCFFHLCFIAIKLLPLIVKFCNYIIEGLYFSEDSLSNFFSLDKFPSQQLCTKYLSFIISYHLMIINSGLIINNFLYLNSESSINQTFL